MAKVSRRTFLRNTVRTSAAATLFSNGLAPAIQSSYAQLPLYQPERNAEITVLRSVPAVASEESAWRRNTGSFVERTGVSILLKSDDAESIAPKAAVAATLGAGPDIFIVRNDQPQQFPGKLVDLTNVAEYLGRKYRGWYRAAEKYGKDHTGRWIALPIGSIGKALVYRNSALRIAGYRTVPDKIEPFLGFCRHLKAAGRPFGISFTNTDNGSSFAHWLLWAHGAKLVDENDEIVIVSEETVQALEYSRALGETLMPGSASWMEGTDSRAFIQGAAGMYFGNAPSLLPISETRFGGDPNDGSGISNTPTGPNGEKGDLSTYYTAIVFKHTRYPNAARAYLTFMLEREQYRVWQSAAPGHFTQPLREFARGDVWVEHPEFIPYRELAERNLWNGYAGTLGRGSHKVQTDFVVLNMFAEAMFDAKSPRQAAEDAARRAARSYRI